MGEAQNTIRLAGVIRESIVDGPGIRFVVFAQGCPHGCPGCHNPQTHDFNGGYPCTIDKILKAIDENPLLRGVTFSGGDPVCQPAGFWALAKEVKKRCLDIVMYSGYTFEELCEMASHNEDLDGLLHQVDYLIDGHYEENLRDLTLPFRGSSNQRMIDLKPSLAEKNVVGSPWQ